MLSFKKILFQITQDPFTAISGEDFGEEDSKGHSSARFLSPADSSKMSLQLLEETSSTLATSASSDKFPFELGGGMFSVACFFLGSPPSFKLEQKAALGFKVFGERCNLFASGSSFVASLRFNVNSVSPSSSLDESVIFLGGGL